MRARSKEDGRVQVKVRGGGEAVGELVGPADHLAALGQAVGEVARAFGGRARPRGAPRMVWITKGGEPSTAT